MTEKQKIFAEEYLIDLNATRAYKTAYPTVKKNSVAAQAGSRLLRNVNIKQYIDGRLEEIHSHKTADVQEVMEYLTSVMRGNHTEQVLKLDGNGIQILTDIKVSERDRLKAAELIGKRYAMFSDKVDFNGSVPVVILGDDKLED